MGRSSLVLAMAFALLVSGCSLVAPRYNASLQNVQKLKDADGQAVTVGEFTSTPGSDNPKSISIRGSSLTSPYDGSFAKYLSESIRQELSLAGKLSADAQLEVSGALQKNDISIPPVGKGRGDIAARFVLKRNAEVRYDQVKSAHDEWDSSFVGAVAIPRAQNEYPTLVQKLLAELYADPAFQAALK
jgi:hypothetical protein